MNKKRFSIKHKIDYFYVFLILFFVSYSFYVNRYRMDYIELTDQLHSSFQIKEKLADLNYLLQSTQQTFNEKAYRNTDNSRQYYSEQRSLINGTIRSLESLVSKDLKSKEDINSIRSLSSEYFRTIEVNNFSKTLDKSGLEKQLALFNTVQDRLKKLFYEKEQILSQTNAKLDLSKNESFTAALVLILIILLVVTVSYLKIRNDVKLREKTEIELINKSEELVQINKNKEKLFSIIAHDLRSPFHPILMISEILITSDGELEKKEIINLGQKLKSIGEGVLTLLDNLLAWSRIQTGTLRFNSELFSLKEKVDLALSNLMMDAEKKRIYTSNEVAENLWIISDHNILLSLLQNMISNAIKFTPSGGSVKVTGKMEANNILISVTDTGVGISPEIVNTIFNSSDIQTTVGTNQERGSGLGLLLCKEYVDLHYGKIWVESESGKGSTFSFTIPVKVLSQEGDLFTYLKVKPVCNRDRKSKNLIGVRI